MKNIPDTRSFTLIELMIVVIIVGSLASIAVPMLRNSINQSIRAEAVATIGTLRIAERIYYQEYGTYMIIDEPGGANTGKRPSEFAALGIQTTDLDGA